MNQANSKTAPPAVANAPTVPPATRVEPDAKFWSKAHNGNLAVTIRLLTGDILTGVVHDYGKYTVTLDTKEGRVLVFKNACAYALRESPQAAKTPNV